MSFGQEQKRSWVVLLDMLPGLLKLQEINYVPIITNISGAWARAATPSGHWRPFKYIATSRREDPPAHTPVWRP